MCITDFFFKAFVCVDYNKLLHALRKMGIPKHLIVLMRNLYTGQETTIWTKHGKTDQLPIGKEVQ